MRSTRAVINLKAIRHNLSIVRQLASGVKVMAVVKADAYGHGIVQVANALSDENNSVDSIAVSCMDEALKLRESGIGLPIVLLEGFFSSEELLLAIRHNLQIVIHQQSQLEAVEKLTDLSDDVKLKLWLKLDSGMNRLGFSQALYQDAFNRLGALKYVESVNLMSHLACADDINNVFNREQIEAFNNVTKSLPGDRSMANSAGIVAWPESHYDWVRPGLILYGCSPLAGCTGQLHQLQPAMTLKSQLFVIRELCKGEPVGYGSAWQAKKMTRIGVIAIGYGDGYPRHAREGTPVWIGGKTYPLVGRVSMDMLTVDLGMEDKLEIGEPAILWGDNLPVETIAEFSDTIPYTLLCGVTSRVKFEWQA